MYKSCKNLPEPYYITWVPFKTKGRESISTSEIAGGCHNGRRPRRPLQQTPKRLEHGRKMIYAGSSSSSSPGFGIGGQPCSKFLASTVLRNSPRIEPRQPTHRGADARPALAPPGPCAGSCLCSVPPEELGSLLCYQKKSSETCFKRTVSMCSCGGYTSGSEGGLCKVGSLKGFLVMLERMPKDQFALISGAAEVRLLNKAWDSWQMPCDYYYQGD